MEITAALTKLMYTVGFRNMLVLAGLAGSLTLLWLVLSLPGRRVFKFLLALLCGTGVFMLLAMNPLHSLGVTLPTFAVRLLCLCTSLTILLMIVQLGRLLLMLPALAAALFWRAPLKLLASRRMSLCIAMLGLGLGGLAFWNTIRVPDVRETSIPIKNLPPSLEGFRIVQLTDLHLGTIFNAAWMREVVEKVNTLHADVIVITGDTGEAAPAIISEVLAPLRDLRARDGVYYALGNHETYQGRKEWIEFYRAAGQLLRNNHAVLSRDGAKLVLAGVDDQTPDVTAALAGRPANAPVVLLAHRPATATKNSEEGVSLQLSGHTHGGLLPGVKQVIARANAGFVSGLYRVGDMMLYVSNGTGLWSYVALRLWDPSEITLIRLERQ